MHKEKMTHPAMLLIGIKARTNNQAEMDPASAKIGPTIGRYMGEGIADQIPNRTQPGVTYAVYTDYASDADGDYTYFIGEEVHSHDAIPEGLTALTVPAQTYMRFTTDAGPMPDVCIQAWQRIWNMDANALGGERAYLADLECYDERAQDPANTILDIMIGI